MTYKQIKKNLGIAVDEVILATVMVSSLGAFGVVVVPWDAMVGATSANQIEKQFVAIEKANTRFYKLYTQWPYEMTNGKTLDNIVVLSSRQALKFPYSTMEDFKPMMPNLMLDTTGKGLVARHGLGTNGRIMQRPAHKKSGYAMEIIFENVPLQTAEKIDKAIDGKTNKKTGRILLQPKGNVAHVIYRANKV